MRVGVAGQFGVQEVGGSNPPAPTSFRKEPFGETVEGLSRCGDKSCAVEPVVQTDHFEDSRFWSGTHSRRFILETREQRLELLASWFKLGADSVLVQPVVPSSDHCHGLTRT